MLHSFVIRRMGTGFLAATAGALAASLGVVHFQSSDSLNEVHASTTTLTCSDTQRGGPIHHAPMSGVVVKPHGLACPGQRGSWTVKITDVPIASKFTHRRTVAAVHQGAQNGRQTYQVRVAQGHEFRISPGYSAVSFQAVRFCKVTCDVRQSIPVVAISLKSTPR